MGWIFETLDFLTEIELFSDKCGQRELLKLEDDFRKDIARNAKKTKANLWKYIKEDTQNDSSEEESEKDPKKKDGKEKSTK